MTGLAEALMVGSVKVKAAAKEPPRSSNPH